MSTESIEFQPNFEINDEYIVEHLNTLIHITIMSFTRKCVRVKFENNDEKWMYIDQFKAKSPNTPEYKIVEKVK
jgi:hypothetical protein